MDAWNALSVTRVQAAYHPCIHWLGHRVDPRQDHVPRALRVRPGLAFIALSARWCPSPGGTHVMFGFTEASVCDASLLSLEAPGTSGNLRELQGTSKTPVLQAGSSLSITAIRKQPGMRDCIPLDVCWESRRKKLMLAQGTSQIPNNYTLRALRYDHPCHTGAVE